MIKDRWCFIYVFMGPSARPHISFSDIFRNIIAPGSILGPLLFNIFINDLFFFTDKVNLANYADDNTAYVTNDRFDKLVKILEAETSVILHWFRMNCMKWNDDKCKLIIVNTNNVSLNMGNATIEASESVKLFGVSMDNELKFVGRRGAVVKRVEHFSTIVLVNIWVARVRVPLVLSVGIWICKNSTINT